MNLLKRRKKSRPVTAKAMAAPGAAPEPGAEYTIDELAHVAGSTVRNVRAYQDRGLLEGPVLRGRTGIYSSVHLTRLRLINHLLMRGYTLSNIQELVHVLEDGHSLRNILGLHSAIASPWSDEAPRYFTMPELMKVTGFAYTPKLLKKVIDLGLLEPDGLRYRAPQPRMLTAGAELRKVGIDLEKSLELITQLRLNVEQVADAMFKQILPMLDRYGAGELPPKEEVPKLASLIWQLRPLLMMAVESEVSRALELAANKYLGERVEQVLELMQQGRPADL